MPDPMDGMPQPQLSSGQETVGALLARVRMGHGTTIREASGSLRIREEYLDAIEQGRFDDLPGMTYAIGYVRSYAQSLGLDAGEIVDRFKAEADAINARPELAFPSPAPEGKVPGGAVLFVSFLLATVAYGGWYWAISSDRSVASLVPAVPESLSSLLAPAGETAADSGETTSVAAPAHAQAPQADKPVPVMSASAASTQPTDTQAVAEDEPAPVSIPVAAQELEPAAPAVPQDSVRLRAGDQAPSEPEAVAADGSAEGLAESVLVSGVASDDGSEIASSEPALTETTEIQDVMTEVAAAPPTSDQSEKLNSVIASLRTSPVAVATGSASSDTTTDSPDGTEPQAATEVEETETSILPRQRPDASSVSASSDADVTVGVDDAADATGGIEDTATEAEPVTTTATEIPASEAPVAVASLPPPPSIPAAPSVDRADDPVGGARVVIRATSDSWVQVRDGGSTPIMTRVMRAGDVYRVPARSDLRLFTGNAGALEILLDGDPIAKIGAFGQIARDVRLDPSALAAR